MRLTSPFLRIPLNFDADRLREEASLFAEEEWSPHPQGFEGNSALILIAAHGEINDLNRGSMLPTPHLDRTPYIRQVLAAFGTVVGRSRLMRLAPGCAVPSHVDLHYYWHRRVRVHIPIVTHPAVRFECGGEELHMEAGEPWLLDTWRRHGVRNDSPITRIHLVFDTVGTAAFWDLVSDGGEKAGARLDDAPVRHVPWEPSAVAEFPLERFNLPIVMPPDELEAAIDEALGQLDATARSRLEAEHSQAQTQLRRFVQDWRAAWATHGADPVGRPVYAFLQKACLASLASLSDDLRLATNGQPIGRVLRARIKAALNPDPTP